jgi:hypothetical protein
MTKQIANRIAHRVFTVGKPGKRAEVLLGRPRRSRRGEWVCAFQFKGMQSTEIQRAFGVDALQALLNAVEGIRTTIEKQQCELSWAGGSGSGIPAQIPLYFGEKFARRITKMLERELRKFAIAAQKGAGRKSGKQRNR